MRRESEQSSSGSGRFVWAAITAAVLALVAAGLFASADGANAMGRGHWGHHGNHDPEAMKEHLALGVEMMLRHVDASDDQKDRATEIAESAFDALVPMLSTHRDGREQMVALLSEETIDREALEALRAELVARFDTASRTLAGSLADLAETLTPEQRAELLEHGRGHRGWHRRW